MLSVVKAAFAYAVPVFALGFVLGALCVMLVAPVTGPLLAVGVELPVILTLSWVIAGRVLTRWGLLRPARVVMGALAFALLMLAELLVAVALGQSATGFISALGTPPGALGLAGQIAFGLIPSVRPYPPSG